MGGVAVCSARWLCWYSTVCGGPHTNSTVCGGRTLEFAGARTLERSRDQWTEEKQMKSKALKVWFKAQQRMSGALVSTFECAGVGAGAEEARLRPPTLVAYDLIH